LCGVDGSLELRSNVRSLEPQTELFSRELAVGKVLSAPQPRSIVLGCQRDLWRQVVVEADLEDRLPPHQQSAWARQDIEQRLKRWFTVLTVLTQLNQITILNDPKK
jgi:hypothetical protein